MIARTETLHSPKLFDEEIPAGFDGKFHWDYLIEPVQKATGRKITPMDIDCHIEIGGHFLMIETKRPGVPVPGGQRRALLQHWGKGTATIIFLWGKVDPHVAEVWYPSAKRYGEGGRVDKSDKTMSDLRLIVYKWAKWANENPHPFQYGG